MTQPLRPPGIPNSPQQVVAAADRAAAITEIRQGIVVSYSADVVNVLLAGGLIVDAAYMQSFQPFQGDQVIIAHQDTQYTVLGNVAGNPPDNAVINPSFEKDTIGFAPANWANFHDPGSTGPTDLIVVGVSGANAASGAQCLTVEVANPGIVADTVLTDDFTYSDPFPVNAGDYWVASAFTRFDASPGGGNIGADAPASCVAVVTLEWYATASAVHPNQIGTSPDNLNRIWYDGTAPFWGRVPDGGPPGGNAVPPGAHYGRVVLRASFTVPGFFGNTVADLFWDNIVARRVG